MDKLHGVAKDKLSYFRTHGGIDPAWTDSESFLAWMKEHGVTGSRYILRRRNKDLPWGPTNCYISGSRDRDALAMNGDHTSLDILKWDETVAFFKKALANSSDRARRRLLNGASNICRLPTEK